MRQTSLETFNAIFSSKQWLLIDRLVIPFIYFPHKKTLKSIECEFESNIITEQQFKSSELLGGTKDGQQSL